MTGVLFSREGRLAHVRLDRAASLNAITPAMDEALHQAWTAINADDDIWAAVLSADGERAFCVGADIGEGLDDSRPVAFGGGLTGIGGPLVELRKPLVAAVQGYVLGGGFELAMCADIIVAASNTIFGLPEAKIGVIGHCGVVHRAMRQLPYRVALGIALTGERLGAAEALGYGLVNEVVGFPELEAATRRWTDRLQAVSPLAVRAIKQAALEGFEAPLGAALAARYPAIDDYGASADFREALAALADRRPPAWRGG